MYYLMMKTAIKPDLKTKIFCNRNRKTYFNLREKDIIFDTIKDNEFLKKGSDINKIDILFDKIERKND